MLAFLLAVGIAAHALDELHGHPLRTAISDGALWVAAVTALGGLRQGSAEPEAHKRP